MDGVDGVFFAKAAAYIGAAIAMGLGSFGPAIGQGLIGMKACESIGKRPDAASDIRNTMLLAMGVVESSAVYALIIALLLIFLAP